SYLVDNQNKANTVTMKRDEKIHTFSINASILNDTGDILISLQDITELKEKEKLIVQQSKMASMGEMLTNIAHQWRQPLSMISTSATSVSMQQEYGILNDEKLNKSMDDINNSAQFLSKTIEDFRNFFDENKIYSEFEVKDILDKTLQILSGNFRNKAIEIKLEIDELKVFGLDSELMQVLINILNNARDIFEEKELNDKLILIKSYKDGNDIVISIHDNAGGIPENIIEKIFEPYFTTKHQSQGTGIGLYMSYDIITKNMSGKLKATNELINHNDSNRLGAKFEIIIPSNIK
ncbi:MAG TPA: GHKL domain-containing protein, partial [Arcobacter sp.]|nr:GHKL domain-containing protein [Arcobacter sp.]